MNEKFQVYQANSTVIKMKNFSLHILHLHVASAFMCTSKSDIYSDFKFPALQMTKFSNLKEQLAAVEKNYKIQRKFL